MTLYYYSPPKSTHFRLVTTFRVDDRAYMLLTTGKCNSTHLG